MAAPPAGHGGAPVRFFSSGGSSSGGGGSGGSGGSNGSGGSGGGSGGGGGTAAAGRPASFLRTFASIYRAGGMRALYAGITPTLLRAAPSNAIIFLVYEEAIKAFDDAVGSGAAPA